MKNCLVIGTLLLLFTNFGLSQCPTDLSLTYATQFDIDTFKLKYPNCKNLFSITLLNSNTDPIRNLSGFSNIDSIRLSLVIQNQSELVSLVGLEKLRTVANIQITNCPKLQNMVGLDNLKRVNGSIQLNKINNLTSLSGLNSLDSILYDIDLNELPTLNNLEGLHLIKNVGNLKIRFCSALTQLTGLENVEKIKGSLLISDCPVLNSLAKLEKLKYIRNDFIISNNNAMIEISKINALEYIGDDLEITFNKNLRNIIDFAALNKIEFGGLKMSYNNLLETVNGFNKLKIVKKGIEITDKSLITLKGFNDLLSVGFNFENFSNLVEVSGFENLKKATEVNFIFNDKLAVIPAFNAVDSITGNITIKSCPLITDIIGFNIIKYIGGELIINNNNNLKTIPPFNLLESVKSLAISNNQNVEALGGLASLRSIDDIDISTNAKLLTLPEFNLIKTMNGSFHIYNNPLLTNIPSLENLTSTYSYYILNNKSIEVINACPKLETVGALFWIIGTDKLTEISGFDKLRKVGAFGISNNIILKKIPSFNSLMEIPSEYLSIKNNPVLESIIGFNQLSSKISYIEVDQNGIKTVTGFNNLVECKYIRFEKNPDLVNIEGFDKLEKGNIFINTNNALVSIPSFNNIHYPTYKDYECLNLEISFNPKLKQINGFRRLQNASKIKITKNDALEEIIGFEDVVKTQEITIKGLSIRSLPAFNKLKVIGIETEDFGFTSYSGLYLEEMPKLEKISGFNSVDSIKGWLQVVSNTSLKEVSAFKNLKRVHRNLIIYQNDSLKTWTGLENLTLIGGHYVIKKNNILKELPNTRSLHTIRGQYTSGTFGFGPLDISGDSISTLKGLHNLTRLNGQLIISKTNLSGLQGLENLDPQTTGLPYIFDNPKLSNCSIYFLCEKIRQKPIGCNIVENNATGCNKCSEVKCEDMNLEGLVYYDFDKNKMYGSNEVALSEIRILILPDSVELLPKSNGKFVYTCEIGKKYKIKPVLNTLWDITTDSLEYNFTFQQNIDRTKKLNFGLHPNFEKHAGQISIISSQTRCNTVVPFNITYKNTGTFEESGKFILTLDPMVNFESSDPTPTVVIGNKYVWNYQKLKPYNINSIKANLMMPGEQSVGSLLNFYGELFSDTNLLTDYDYTPTVICSYDPNDKLVMPADSTKENKIINNQLLTYTIRFQNEGNAEAIDVIVRDTFSELLDMASFEIVNSSHPVQTWIKGNTVEFYFKNIYLPSKNFDETRSQGFITYNILPVVGLDPGQKIMNEAFIYFDLNSPIQTNLTVSTIHLPNAVSDVDKDEFIKIYPNPSKGIMYVQSDKRIDHITIYSLTGSQICRSHQPIIDVSEIPAGMYIAKVKIDNRWFSELIVVQP